MGSMALLVVLSAFSGLEKFSLSMLSTFDPDIKISPVLGKTFTFNDSTSYILDNEDEILSYSKTLEEKVFLRYRDKEFISNIKGVDSCFSKVNAVDTTLYSGRWFSKEIVENEVIVGGGISHYLSLGLNDKFKPLEIFVVIPGKGQISNPINSFRRKNAYPVGLFAIEKEIDQKYVISQLAFAQKLLNYSNDAIGSIEIKLKDPLISSEVSERLKHKFGDRYIIKTQREQHAVVYKMMNTEKIVTYLIFTLILIIAVFNVIGSISMLIVDKKENLKTLWNIGIPESVLKKVFVDVGLLVTFIGGISGVVIGTLLVLAQYYFKIITFGSASSMAYPVELSLYNLLVVIVTIFTIGYIASKVSVRKLNKELLH